MGLGAVLRPVARLVRSVPGYPRVRRRALTRLRHSPAARRVARSTYPDLRDKREVQAKVNRRVTAAVADERKRSAAALERLRTELTTKQEARLSRVRSQHRAEVRALRAEHKETLRRTKADIARKADRQRRAIPAVSAGDLVAGLYLGDRPLLLLDVRGVEEPTAGAILEEVALEQVLGCAFRPMFLTDLKDPSVWQRYGHLCEQVPPEAGWQGVLPFESYLAQRLESIRADLGARWYLPVHPDGLTATQRAFLRRCGR